ncbi:MAG: BTAD domain-containing putative transcriptional regulator [Acidimicrobiales bacterium]
MPPAIADELVRNRLIERLDGRWDAVVTTVVAGPGFGKSTTLAQAIRANHAHPKGIDAWVSCEPGDEDADRLAAAILRAIDAPFAGPDGAVAIASGLRQSSPVPICLVIDDLHELPDGSSAMSLIAEVIRHLPAHAHLVVAGRRPISLPLARLRAADRVLEITQHDLAFTTGEIDVLAFQAGHDHRSVATLAGWPALVRLALAAPAGAGRRYVWEEVLARLSDEDRRALLALSILGTADAASLSQLCGQRVDVEQLTSRIPLVVDTGDGRVRAHDLWHETLAAMLPAEEVRPMGRDALAQLLATGAYVRAGSLAARIGDHDALSAAALILVRNTIGSLPVDTAAAWLAAAPPAERSRPELVLLGAALAHALCDTDPNVEEQLAFALDGFRLRRTPDGLPVPGEYVVLGLRLALAHTRGDLAALAELVVQTQNLPGADRDPVLAALPPAAAGLEAHLMGDVERAADILGGIPLDGVPSTVAEVIRRLRWHCLIFDGRGEEAARLGADHLARASTPNAALFASVANWLAGDPSGFDDVEPLGLADYETRSARATLPYNRDWFNLGIFTATVWASAGDRRVVARAVALLDALDVDLTSARSAAPVAAARATEAVVDHDEDAAVAILAELTAAHPLTDRLTDVYLRRFLAVPYLCSAEARQRWDDEELGPSHRLQRDVARALLRARKGRLTRSAGLPPAPAIFTALPLPWSVELACRATAAGHPGGARLAQWLVDRLGTVVQDELRVMASADDTKLARGAGSLLRTVPFPPGLITRVEVLGPLRLLVDGQPVERPESRRARVRELLALLVVFGSIGRERAMDLLWPELAPADAARNLRVTLTYLRRWLEPERGRGEAGFHVRVEGEQIRLASSDRLTVDAWEAHDHLQAAGAARRVGDVAEQARHIELALELWRGMPLIDFERLAEIATEAEHLRVRLADAALALGELRLAEGDTTGTIACAEKVLAANPYAERALRLLLAAHVQRGDRLRARTASRRTLAALAELGLPPQPETAILLRQAGLPESSLEAVTL